LQLFTDDSPVGSLIPDFALYGITSVGCISIGLVYPKSKLLHMLNGVT